MKKDNNTYIKLMTFDVAMHIVKKHLYIIPIIIIYLEKPQTGTNGELEHYHFISLEFY